MTRREQVAETGTHDEFVDALAQATFMTMAILTSVAADHDLSLTQLRVLAILRDRRVRMSALADHLGLDKSTLSGLVDRAEKRGLVTRVPSPDDRRAVDVTLSREGDDLAGALTARIAQRLAPATARLTAAERHRLQALLQRLTGS